MGNRSSLISPHPLRNQPRGDDHSPKCQIPQPEGTELGSGPRLSDPTPHSLPASTSPDRADGLTLLPGAPAHQAASRRKSSEIQVLPFMKTSAVCIPHALCLPNPSSQACRAEGRPWRRPWRRYLLSSSEQGLWSPTTWFKSQLHHFLLGELGQDWRGIGALSSWAVKRRRIPAMDHPR